MRKILKGVFIGSLVTLALLIALTATIVSSPSTPSAASPPPQPTAAAVPTPQPTAAVPPPNTPQPSSAVWEGPFQKDLGIRSDVYGSDWQGRELQAMIDAKRNAQVYRLSAQTSQGEHVEITADLRDNGSIYRKHWGPNGGPARAESWTGNVRSRIDNAASGKGFGGDVIVRTV